MKTVSVKRPFKWPGQWTAHTEGTQPELEQRRSVPWVQLAPGPDPWTGPAAKRCLQQSAEALRGYLPAEDVPPRDAWEAEAAATP